MLKVLSCIAVNFQIVFIIADDNEYESSLDNDDDISSDEDIDSRRIDSDVRLTFFFK